MAVENTDVMIVGADSASNLEGCHWLNSAGLSCLTITDHVAGLAVIQEKKKSAKVLVIDPQGAPDALTQVMESAGTRRGLSIPFIVYSAVEDLNYMRFCLALGAADYIVKPTRANDFIIRIERALSVAAAGVVKNTNRPAFKHLIPRLTFKEYQILSLLESEPNNEIDRMRLFKALWVDTNVNPKTLDVHIFNLRRKIRDEGLEIQCKGGLLRLEVHTDRLAI